MWESKHSRVRIISLQTKGKLYWLRSLFVNHFVDQICI